MNAIEKLELRVKKRALQKEGAAENKLYKDKYYQVMRSLLSEIGLHSLETDLLIRKIYRENN